MFVGGYETVLSAQELVSALTALHKGEVRSEIGVQESMPVWLQASDGRKKMYVVKLDPDRGLYDELPDGSTLLRSITPEGTHIDFLSPPESQRRRGFMNAIAFVQQTEVG